VAKDGSADRSARRAQRAGGATGHTRPSRDGGCTGVQGAKSDVHKPEVQNGVVECPDGSGEAEVGADAGMSRCVCGLAGGTEDRERRGAMRVMRKRGS